MERYELLPPHISVRVKLLGKLVHQEGLCRDKVLKSNPSMIVLKPVTSWLASLRSVGAKLHGKLLFSLANPEFGDISCSLEYQKRFCLISVSAKG